jgi:hypothetical protein
MSVHDHHRLHLGYAFWIQIFLHFIRHRQGVSGEGLWDLHNFPHKIWFFLNLGRSSAFGQKAPFMDNSGIKGLF